MLDNITSIDKQYRDPETLSSEDFQLYLREKEQIKKIEDDIKEQEKTINGWSNKKYFNNLRDWQLKQATSRLLKITVGRSWIMVKLNSKELQQKFAKYLKLYKFSNNKKLNNKVIGYSAAILVRTIEAIQFNRE